MKEEECPGPGWVRLRDLVDGTLFAYADGNVGVAMGKAPNPDSIWVKYPEESHTYIHNGEAWVYPVPDLYALIQENQEMANLVHDRREDMATWIEHGAQMERGTYIRYLMGYANRLGGITAGNPKDSYASHCLGLAAKEVQKKGPVLPPLPPERLYNANQRLKASLREIFTLLGTPQTSTWTDLIRAARALAEAALEEGGK